MRRGMPLSGRKEGSDSPDWTKRASADSSPAMKRSGGRTSTSCTGAQPAAARSSSARATAARNLETAFGNAHGHACAPHAAARSCAPSRTRCGDRSNKSLSLSLAGSPSMALTRTVPPAPAVRATLSLVAAGKPAPPRPPRPETSSAATTAVAPPAVLCRSERNGTQRGDVGCQVSRMAEQLITGCRGGAAHQS